jgi:hypothetical protein
MLKNLINMFSSPFSVEIDAMPTNLQLEFANFKTDPALKENSMTYHISKSIQNILPTPPNKIS